MPGLQTTVSKVLPTLWYYTIVGRSDLYVIAVSEAILTTWKVGYFVNTEYCSTKKKHSYVLSFFFCLQSFWLPPLCFLTCLVGVSILSYSNRFILYSTSSGAGVECGHLLLSYLIHARRVRKPILYASLNLISISISNLVTICPSSGVARRLRRWRPPTASRLLGLVNK